MALLAYAAYGFEGYLVSVEVDIRRGIPGLDVIGLPDSAVKEARERIRASIRNCQFDYPAGRILISLAPAGRRKEGAAFDLAMALGILLSHSLGPWRRESDLLAMGELTLGGKVRSVPGVLSAVAAGKAQGIRDFLVPRPNLREALLVEGIRVFGIESLKELPGICHRLSLPGGPGDSLEDRHTTCGGPEEKESLYPVSSGPGPWGDFSDIHGQEELKRAMEIAAAGGHHMLLFGPPGSGKTMAVKTFPGILPLLSFNDALEVTRIYSQAGLLGENAGLVLRPPVRSPHHTASGEGLIGGGKLQLPGEVSLAHKGVLFLDEAPEFRKNILQNLREPLESAKVHLVRAERNCWFPAEFQLILAANPCPCGNLGKDKGICVCSPQEVRRYWLQLGGALMDRIDMRIPVKPASTQDYRKKPAETSGTIRDRIERAAAIQKNRYQKQTFSRNNRIPPGKMASYCPLEASERSLLEKSMKQLGLSSRAADSIVKLARTIADLEGAENIGKYHLLEAMQYRRYGDGNYYWRPG